MTEFAFNEDDLKTAAKLVCNAMLDSLPSPSEIDYNLSHDFKRKMDAFCTKARRREQIRIALKRVAMVFLAILLGLSIWLTVDTDARATALKWIREVLDNTIDYRFSGGSVETKLPNYVPTWLPDGFVLTESHNYPMQHIFVYEDTESNMISFSYLFLSEGTLVSYSGDDSDRETVYIQGMPADFYPADETSLTNNLIWVDESNGIVFLIDSNLEKETMLQTANSAKLCDIPK